MGDPSLVTIKFGMYFTDNTYSGETPMDHGTLKEMNQSWVIHPW
jgi:hypothetical protein